MANLSTARASVWRCGTHTQEPSHADGFCVEVPTVEACVLCVALSSLLFSFFQRIHEIFSNF